MQQTYTDPKSIIIIMKNKYNLDIFYIKMSLVNFFSSSVLQTFYFECSIFSKKLMTQRSQERFSASCV